MNPNYPPQATTEGVLLHRVDPLTLNPYYSKGLRGVTIVDYNKLHGVALAAYNLGKKHKEERDDHRASQTAGNTRYEPNREGDSTPESQPLGLP